MRWRIEWTDEFDDWWGTQSESTQEAVVGAVSFLEEEGPNAGRPTVDTVKNSKHPNMKELRPNPTIRVFFAFDPRRVAVLLVAGDKAGKTKRFYRQMVSKADKIYAAHLGRIREESKNGP